MGKTRELAAQIAANFAPNAETPEEVMQLLQDSYKMLQGMGGDEEGSTGEATESGGSAKAEPVMDPDKAVGNDAITCLICGKSFKTLKRHLQSSHNTTPEEYRAMFNLSKDYPLVAPKLSKARAQRAKELGLGERLAEARKEQLQQKQGG